MHGYGFQMDFIMIASALAGILSSGLMIAASIVLLRERSLGPYLMLMGSVISVISVMVSRVLPFFHIGSLQAPIMFVASLGGLGGLVFAGGLLHHALTRSGQAKRIAELELIVEAQNERIREFQGSQ